MSKMKLKNPISSSFWSLFLRVTLLCFVCLLLQSTTTIATALGNETDRFALLKFKESLSGDPYGVKNSWNDSIHFCKWAGVSCGRRHQRITALNLEGYKMRGSMSPYIGNLSFLRFINMKSNSFFGEIPPQIGHLQRLRHLNLSDNMLEGKIPVNLSYCSNLRILRLGRNKLTGMIPSEFSSLTRLVGLGLDTNNLTGVIPTSFSNISSLRYFSVGYNNLMGTIPYEFGRLKRLTFFAVGINNLSGEIPLSLYNMSSISTFETTTNRFKGTLPSNIGFTLPNLEIFIISSYEFSGIIPYSFSNATRLQMFDIQGINFLDKFQLVWEISPIFWWLGLDDNSLGNNLANSLDFIPSLTNCSQLKSLGFGMNSCGGVLPNSVANLSTRFIEL